VGILLACRVELLSPIAVGHRHHGAEPPEDLFLALWVTDYIFPLAMVYCTNQHADPQDQDRGANQRPVGWLEKDSSCVTVIS
jgi:hypothetical protein